MDESHFLATHPLYKTLKIYQDSQSHATKGPSINRQNETECFLAVSAYSEPSNLRKKYTVYLITAHIGG